MTDFVFWGAAGHALVLADFLEAGGHRIVALFDNDPTVQSVMPNVPLWIGTQGFLKWRSEISEQALPQAAIAIGGSYGHDRCKIAVKLRENGIELPVLTHPSAVCARDARVGIGSQLLAGSVVGARAMLGRCVIVNTNASVDHESMLGDGVHIAPGATLCGRVSIGQHTLVGPRAVVLPRVRIGEDSVIGAGAVVTRDVPDGVVAWGVPARIIRENRK